jgi:class 3 adenylate cyclase
MGPSRLFLKDPQTSRFIGGGLGEAESLLGTPLPTLPPPETDGGQAVYLVRWQPSVRPQILRVVVGLLAQIGVDVPAMGPSANRNVERDQAEYEATLTKALRLARQNDRRLGLTNLFWLAHTREVAEVLHELEAKHAPIRRAKYSLYPLLSSAYRRIDQGVRRDVMRSDPERQAVLTGAREDTRLVECLLEDGFALTETSIADLDFNQFLASNKRYRLSTELFFEILTLLNRETERRIRENDRLIISRINRYLPGLQREAWLAQPGLTKVTLSEPILNLLLSDCWTTGAKLVASSRLKSEAGRRRPIEILDAFRDLVRGVKRFEVASYVRERVRVFQPDSRDLEDLIRRGLRMYEFGNAAQVVNNGVNATVLFLDLRGFTKTSEGQISERDLTQELYAVFDTFVPIVKRFGGTIDKFLGDGIMVTFGTVHADPLDPLDAVRVAIQCQEALRRLRQEGRTYFKMGIAVHYGRVYLARFIPDEQSIQSTVIGRNVNLAGRLSSAAKRPIDEDENGEPEVVEVPYRPSGLSVVVDEAGRLFNQGIAISRDTLAQLEMHLPLNHIEDHDDRHLEYYDEAIGRKIVIRYAGDAKFKGVRSSFPVYEVDHEE